MRTFHPRSHVPKILPSVKVKQYSVYGSPNELKRLKLKLETEINDDGGDDGDNDSDDEL